MNALTSGWLAVMRCGNVGIFRCRAYAKWLVKSCGFSPPLCPRTMMSGRSLAGSTGSSKPLSGSAHASRGAHCRDSTSSRESHRNALHTWRLTRVCLVPMSCYAQTQCPLFIPIAISMRPYVSANHVLAQMSKYLMPRTAVMKTPWDTLSA